MNRSHNNRTNPRNPTPSSFNQLPPASRLNCGSNVSSFSHFKFPQFDRSSSPQATGNIPSVVSISITKSPALRLKEHILLDALFTHSEFPHPCKSYKFVEFPILTLNWLPTRLAAASSSLTRGCWNASSPPSPAPFPWQ